MSRAERVLAWLAVLALLLVLADVSASVRQMADDYRAVNVEDEEVPAHLDPPRA